ncbi:MAG TPA: protein kinase [Myxococcaceae bacterium]|nr:protein kinase [Myxococcaceae bacterium]
MPTYRLTGRLSSGELYERHAGLTEDGKPVALQLYAERASEPKLVQAVADAAHQIASGAPALLAPVAAGVVKKRVVVVFPHVDGVTLQSALTRLHNRELLLQPPVTLALVLELLDALSRAGERGAWHGALTPDAVFLDQELGVRIGDFGLGGASASLANLRKLLWPKAREAYRPPEAAQGQAPSEAGDVYSAGALAYELFTLHKPGGDKAQVSSRREAPAPPSRLDRRINPRLDPVLLKALEYAAARRYRTCQELAQALRSAAAAVGGAAASSEVRKLAADLRAREEDRTLGPPPWAEPFQVESLGEMPAAPDRTEVASVAMPVVDPKYDRTMVDPKIDPRSVSLETPQVDDKGGWNKEQDTISTVGEAVKQGVLRPIRPDSQDGIAEDAPGRTRPMRPKGAKATAGVQRGKGFMPARVDSPPRSEPARSEPSARPLVDRPPAAPPPARAHRSPTLVVLLDTLRRRKRFLLRISVMAALVAIGLGFGIKKKLDRDRQLQRERDMAALFGGPSSGGQTTQPADPARPPLPKEIAGTPEYATPGPDGAAFLTVLADVPSWVLIDGARLPRTTPVFRVPVPPGNHLVMVMDGTGASRQQDLPFEAGQLQRMDVKLSRKTAP